MSTNHPNPSTSGDHDGERIDQQIAEQVEEAKPLPDPKSVIERLRTMVGDTKVGIPAMEKMADSAFNLRDSEDWKVALRIQQDVIRTLEDAISLLEGFTASPNELEAVSGNGE